MGTTKEKQRKPLICQTTYHHHSLKIIAISTISEPQKEIFIIIITMRIGQGDTHGLTTTIITILIIIIIIVFILKSSSPPWGMGKEAPTGRQHGLNSQHHHHHDQNQCNQHSHHHHDHDEAWARRRRPKRPGSQWWELHLTVAYELSNWYKVLHCNFVVYVFNMTVAFELSQWYSDKLYFIVCD